MKISVISTVKNEEGSIEESIKSVIDQTLAPTELIIVDGGSTDNTFNILKKYAENYEWIKVYQLIGANISKGRNFAISKTSGEFIFSLDGSTTFERDWIKNIMKGFENGGDVVFGKYYVKPKNVTERFLQSRLPNWNKINEETFLPTNKNAAFKKIVWKKIGGFPEYIRRGEDTIFHIKGHELGFKYKFVKNASICWHLNRNFGNMLRLAFLDSKSDGFSLIFKKRKTCVLELFVFLGLIISILISVVNVKFSLLFFIPFTLIFIYEGFLKTLIITKNFMLSTLSIFLSFFLYFSHTFGIIVGIIERLYNSTEP